MPCLSEIYAGIVCSARVQKTYARDNSARSFIADAGRLQYYLFGNSNPIAR